MVLRDFIETHRAEILARARLRVEARDAPLAVDAGLTHGLPVFFEQLREALRRATEHEVVDHAALQTSAGSHGDELFRHGQTVAQVVNSYGDLCQVITSLAVEQDAAIAPNEFQTLNLCLDDAISGAVTAFAHQRESAITNEGTERLGILAHEMRNVLNAAMMSFASIQKGLVAPGGSTAAMHARSLLRLNRLIDRSLADVRLDAGMQNLERVSVSDILEEVQIGAAATAEERGLRLTLTRIEHAVEVHADRQILAAAVANLVQNAIKFTRAGTGVHLRASSTATRVLIEVQDQCGGLPAGQAQALLRPFAQRGSDRSGLGLGLSICAKAAASMSGELRVRDLPGEGCVFAIDLPRLGAA